MSKTIHALVSEEQKQHWDRQKSCFKAHESATRAEKVLVAYLKNMPKDFEPQHEVDPEKAVLVRVNAGQVTEQMIKAACDRYECTVSVLLRGLLALKLPANLKLQEKDKVDRILRMNTKQQKLLKHLPRRFSASTVIKLLPEVGYSTNSSSNIIKRMLQMGLIKAVDKRWQKMRYEKV